MADLSKEHLYALIVCGGSGTRLWPRSRKKTPKQFLENFYGEKSLFTQTVERVSLLTSADKIFVIASAEYVDEILEQGKVILPKNIIIEPSPKNTAMAIGVGAAYIGKVDEEAIIMNFWSDALIKENDLFAQKLNLAVRTASETGCLVTVGLKPTFPHTGMGYIEAGDELNPGGGVFRVNSFKEKPDLVTAQGFLSKGNFYWNTGIFVWSAKAIFKAFSKYSPAIFSILEDISKAIGTPEEKDKIIKSYEGAEELSIDVAVAEKAKNMLMIPANFTWSDIGDWKVTYDLKDKDADGNVIEVFGKTGQHLGVDTKNCLIEIKDRLVATVGISDLIIVETDDTLLICSKEKTQDVKKIVNILKEREKIEFL